jgi:hypothetical protein
VELSGHWTVRPRRIAGRLLPSRAPGEVTLDGSALEAIDSAGAVYSAGSTATGGPPAGWAPRLGS